MKEESCEIMNYKHDKYIMKYNCNSLAKSEYTGVYNIRSMSEKYQLFCLRPRSWERAST